MPFDPALALNRSQVLPEWIDYNGHMNVAFYVLAFDKALDSFCERYDLSLDYMKRSNCSTFVLEAHVTYQQEVLLGDPLHFTLQLLDVDPKRLHYFMRMYHADKGFLAATSEQLMVHVDMSDRRVAPMPTATLARLEALTTEHAGLPRPEEAGRIIGIRRKNA
ncbi:MAG TPA: thioesterase family protein [Candidatus Sulfotelmatobacter sp.]|nr:thioesterase family protein [Candidatus Sulfotelmatobacter sp.]